MQPASLYRLNETQWSFQKGNKEIRIITPGFTDRAADFELAQRLQSFLASEPKIENFTRWECRVPPNEMAPDDISKRWQIRDITSRYYKNLQAESLIYKREFGNLDVRVLEVKPESYLDAITLFFKKWIPWLQSPPAPRKEFAAPFPNKDIPGLFFQNEVYRDPFTKLGAAVLQRDETPFVSEHATEGSYQYVLDNGTLRLEHSSVLSSPEKIRAAVRAYRDFLNRGFEWRMIRNNQKGMEVDLKFYPRAFDRHFSLSCENQFFGYLKESFGIDFDELLEKGMPLLPDHVYKCNIAANHIEMAQVESFFLRLDRRLKPSIQQQRERQFDSPEAFYSFLKEIGVESAFSLKEIKGIYHSFIKHEKDRTLSGLKTYLDSFVFLRKHDGFGEAIRCLTPKAFHQLMDMLTVDSGLLEDPHKERLENFYTGRKIVHLGICGYKTMGNRAINDPCRNLSELLHVYPLLRAGNGLAHKELLAHVVCKKALQTCHPARDGSKGTEWRVGRLIPFGDHNEISQWYYVDGYLNDGGGDVNYVLIPACKEYLASVYEDPMMEVRLEKKAPIIKLYRSTASDAEAESSIDSLLADVNPQQVGSLHFDRGDDYERPYFQRSTMPLWMGYLVLGDVDKAAEMFLNTKAYKNFDVEQANGKEENILQCLAWQKKYRGNGSSEEDAKRIFQAFKTRVGEEKLHAFLTKTSLGSEWAKYNKVPQDIYFIGHSLGGALSQAGLYHFGPREGRIPLFGCNYKCFAFDPPGGVTSAVAEQFLEFGREHKDLLLALGQRWGIHYQFEYRDFVPQGGPMWLGISKNSARDTEWLDLSGIIFEPRPTAKNREITTMPTHGRRFRHIPWTEWKNECKATALTPEELYEFKCSFWLPGNLRKKFGFLITTPRWTEELIREPLGGTIGYLWLLFLKQLKDLSGSPDLSNRDRSGVTFYTVNGPNYAGFTGET